MDRQENKTPSISPTPDSDSTNLSVETIINNNSQHAANPNNNQPTAVKSLNNSSSTAQLQDGDAQHLYNIPDLVTNPKKDKEVFTTETIVSQNPNINNASASSSVTLITGPNKSILPITIWLAIVQLLLSIALTTGWFSVGKKCHIGTGWIWYMGWRNCSYCWCTGSDKCEKGSDWIFSRQFDLCRIEYLGYSINWNWISARLEFGELFFSKLFKCFIHNILKRWHGVIENIFLFFKLKNAPNHHHRVPYIYFTRQCREKVTQ